MKLLELYLSPLDDPTKFKVIVTKSPAGEGESSSSLPFLDAECDWRITVIRSLEVSSFNSEFFSAGGEQEWMEKAGLLGSDRSTFHPNYLVNIGQILYNSLFPPGSRVEKLLQQSISLAESEFTKLVVRLKLEADVVQKMRLADYPWELLHNGHFLSHRQVEFSRYIAYQAVPPNLLTADKLNVLLVSSGASDEELGLQPLSKKEQKAVGKGLKTASEKGDISQKPLEEATFAELRTYLTEHRGEQAPHVLHFDGHGLLGKRCRECGTMNSGPIVERCRNCNAELPSPQGYLVFEDEDGDADYISAEELGNLLHQSGLSDGDNQTGGVVLVVLSACQSGMAIVGESVFNGAAQNLIAHRVPAVVAMQYSVSVDSATQFTEQFYRSLGQKNSLVVAMSQGRGAMGVEGNQWYRPVLYLRWQDNEGGQLFASTTAPRTNTNQHKKQDWGDAPAVDFFFGRNTELNTLEKWIVNDNCRLVAIVGMGGIGKTNLSLKFCKGGIGKTDLSLVLAKKIKNEFEYFIWRSLRSAPPVEDILIDLIKFLSNQQEFNLPKKLEDKVSLLVQYLQAKRCLLILDNAERILRAEEHAGEYLDGYESYGEVFRQVGTREHQSCLLITSRETPENISLLEGKKRPVRILSLSGLDESAARQIFTTIGSFSGSDEEWKKIIEFYDGNPLALELVARYIRNELGGSLAKFIEEKERIFGKLRDLLDWHFQRFSNYEKEVMYWLAINQEPISHSELKDDVLSQELKNKIPDTLELIERRIPIEKSDNAITLQPVLMEYMTDRLVEEVYDEIKTGNISLLKSHALLKAQTADYIRETQKRLIFKPLVERFNDSDIYIEDRLDEILASLPKPPPSRQKNKRPKPSYAAGNILNLFYYLDIDLTNYDFSNLAVWQAYLQGINLHDVNFSSADLNKSVFTQAFGNILSVAFSHDGKVLAVGSTNGQIRLWRVADGQQLLTCKGHTDGVRSIAFLPENNTLASASNDRTVKIWDVATGKCLKTLEGHISFIRSLAVSLDGQIIASSGDERTVKIWDVATGKCLKTLKGHSNVIRSIAFGSDSTTLISGGHDRTVKIWNVHNGKCLNTLAGHKDRILTVACSFNSQVIASGGEDLKIWNSDNGQLLNTLEGHSDSILSVAFSFSSKILASAGDDTVVKLWDVTTGECLNILQGHTNRIRSIAFSPDGQTLVSSSDDQTLKIWDFYNGQCLNTLRGYTNRIWSVAFSPDGQILASGSDDRTVKIWDFNSGQCLNTLIGHNARIRSVAFSGDGEMLASGSEDQTVRVWDIATGKCLKTLEGHTKRVRLVTFSPNGQILASASENQIMRIWNLDSGECLQVLQDKPHWFLSVTFNHNGQRLATGSEDSTLKIWDVDNGQCLKTLTGHTDMIWSVAFSLDGQILASGSEDQTVKIWDVATGECLQTLEKHPARVMSVSFSLDGQKVFSASADQTVKIWNVASGECFHTSKGYTDRIWSVAFSSDSLKIAHASEEGVIRIWDIENANLLKSLRSPRPYENMNINGVTKGGEPLTEAEKATLKALGAVEIE